MHNLRQCIDHGFEAFARPLYEHQYKTLLVMILIIAAFLSQLPKLTFDTSNESYFHRTDPTLVDYDHFREQFGREEVLILGITPPDVFDTAFPEKLTELHRDIEDNAPYLKDVTSLVNVRDTRGEGNQLIVEDLLEEMPDTPRAMAAFRERVLASDLYRNFLISGDGRMTAIVVETLSFSPQGEGSDDGFGEIDESDVDSTLGLDEERIHLTPEENNEFVAVVRDIVAKYEGPDFEVAMAGGPALDEFFGNAMQQDMGRFLSLAVVVIGIFLFVLFRRISGVVMPLLVVGCPCSPLWG